MAPPSRNSTYSDLKQYCKDNITGITNLLELKDCMKDHVPELGDIKIHQDILDKDGKNITVDTLYGYLDDLKDNINSSTGSTNHITLSTIELDFQDNNPHNPLNKK